MSTLWILGEAKSGKSELAEEILHHLPGRKFYIGTLPRTPEHAEQINKHAERRPGDWELIETTDDLSVATGVIGCRSSGEVVASLLDGFTVYVERQARRWASEKPGLTIDREAPFVAGVHRDYRALAAMCRHLVVVDHITAEPPTPLDYESDPARWRLREVVTRCIADGDRVIYHDRENITHNDTGFVEQVAASMIVRV